MIFSALLAAGVALSLSSVARADRAPLPAPCAYEEEGAPCKTEGERADGICTKEQCSRIAYKDGERTDAKYDCLKCRATPADAPAAEAPSEEPSPPAEAPSDPAPKDAPEVPAASEAPPERTEARGMCSIAGDDRSVAALALVLVIGVGRRRRRLS